LAVRSFTKWPNNYVGVLDPVNLSACPMLFAGKAKFYPRVKHLRGASPWYAPAALTKNITASWATGAGTAFVTYSVFWLAQTHQLTTQSVHYEPAMLL